MTNEKQKEFLERLIAAGEEGLENAQMDVDENQLARELIHDGEASIREISNTEAGHEVAPRRQFLVAEYGAHELLYIARGWAKHTRDGMLLTEEGRLHLKLVPKTEGEL